MLRIKTPATVEPVTLTEAKQYASVHPDTTDDDDMLAGMISAARLKFEEESGYLLTERTYELEVNSCDVQTNREGNSVLYLPIRPALAINSIGDLTAPDPDADPDPIAGDWTLDVDEKGIGRIRLAEGVTISEETVLEFTAGFPIEIGEEQEAEPSVVGVPPLAKLALKTLISHWYRNREAYDERNIRAVAATFESVVRNFRLA